MRSRTRAVDEHAITGINVTPFVDVALVLLIVFIVSAVRVAAPVAIPTDLPRTDARPGVVTATLRVVLSRDGALGVEGRRVGAGELRALAEARHGANAELRAIIAADPAVAHGDVVRVMDVLRLAGVARFAIETGAR